MSNACRPKATAWISSRGKRRNAEISSSTELPDAFCIGLAVRSPSGQPYLVLEYVEGTSIDRHADERSLGIDTRVRLFLDVLSAVAHAHGHLIVHRDADGVALAAIQGLHALTQRQEKAIAALQAELAALRRAQR